MTAVPRTTYLDPDTGILVNLVGAQTHSALSDAEHDLFIVRHIQLAEHPIVGAHDLNHLCAIHRHLFGDVYPFAGRLREVDLRKTADPARCFAPARLLDAMAARIFDHLAAEDHLRGLPREAFVDRLTDYFVDLNHLHPFREGNGRTLRFFLASLASDAGHHVDWTRITRSANLAASRDPAALAHD